MKLDQILNFIGQGKFKEAEKGIASFIKRNKLDVSQKIKLSHAYLKMSQFQKSLKILGPVRPLDFLNTCTNDELTREVEIANVLNFVGAWKTSDYIFHRIEEVCHDRAIGLTSIHAHYYRFRGNNLLNLGKHQEAQSFFQKELDLHQKDFKNKLYAAFGAFRVHVHTVDIQKGIDQLEPYLNQVPNEMVYEKILILNRLGHLYHLAGNNKKALSHLEESQKLSHGLNMRERVYGARVMAYVLKGLGKVEKAKEKVLEAKSLCENYIVPITTIELFIF